MTAIGMRVLKRLSESNGQTLAEYATILGAVLIVVFLVVQAIGVQVAGVINQLLTDLGPGFPT